MMLLNISNRLHKWASGWLVLSTIMAFLIAINLPLANPELIDGSLDGRIAYTSKEALSEVASYSEAGRVEMIWIHLGDIILIALYTSMFCLSISWLFQRGFKHNSRNQRLNIVPILGGFFDLMENIWIIIMILAYPAEPIVLGWLSAISR